MTTKKTHPLTRNSSWKFTQPELRLKGFFTGTKEGKKERIALDIVNQCREGVINVVYDRFSSACCGVKQVGPSAWQRAKVLYAPPSLPKAGEATDSEFSIGLNSRTLSNFSNSSPIKTISNSTIQHFGELADLLCANSLVLLDTHRGKSEAYAAGASHPAGGIAFYAGAGPSICHNPVLLAIALGFLRQACLLVRAGVAEEAIASVKREAVIEAITMRNRSLALRNLQQALPWLCPPVPPGDGCWGGDQSSNYKYFPFPQGYEDRFLELVAAVTRGKAKAFGAKIEDNWHLMDKVRPVLGIWSWLGTKEAKQNAEQIRLTALAKKTA